MTVQRANAIYDGDYQILLFCRVLYWVIWQH